MDTAWTRLGHGLLAYDWNRFVAMLYEPDSVVCFVTAEYFASGKR